jgi:hypothetical protein
MLPYLRSAGAAGMIAGLLLILETACFLLSGWSPQRFADPVQAMSLIRSGGDMLRAASAFGFAGLIATVLLIGGVAARLREAAPTAAAGQLHLGLVGVAGHSLVPLTLWIGVPAFGGLLATNPGLAENGWAGFAQVSNGAHGVGSLFLGVSMVMAGAGLRRLPGWAAWVGWCGVAAGLATVAGLLVIGTRFEAAGGALFLPSLIATVLFRFACGLLLWRTGAARSGDSGVGASMSAEA